MDDDDHCTNKEHETEITRDVGGNPYSLLLFIPPSPHSSIYLCPLRGEKKKSVVILSFSVQTGHCGSHLAKVCAAPAATGERDARERERERATAQITDSDTLSLFLFLPRSALSPWCTHVDLEQGCTLAGEARSREREKWRWGVDGWMDEDVCWRCEVVVVAVGEGIKGHAASIAEQVQGLIGSGNGWSM